MVPWRLVRNEMLRRPGRVLLTLGSVVIGVATVVAVSSAIATTRRSFQELYQTMAGRAALEVRADGGGTFDAGLVDLLQGTPGVQAAVPLLQRRTVIYHEGRRVEMIVLGIDREKEPLARDYVFDRGGWFSDGNEILLEAGFAESLGLHLGDEVLLLTQRRPRRFEVAGLLKPRGAAAFQGGGVVFLSLPRAQYWFRSAGGIDTIHFVLDEGADENAVARALAAQLPPGFSVERPANRTEMAREQLFSNEQGLNMAATLSLVAAAFIVINSFFMNLTERRRQLATLRAIGATRSQVLAMIVGEGLLMGVGGTLLGIVAGIGGAAVLLRVMERIFQTTLPAFEIDAEPLLRAAVLGPGLALAASILPAWAATRISPLEGMRRMPVDASDRRRHLAVWIGWALMIASGAAAVLLYRGLLPAAAIRGVVTAALVGMSLLIPVLLVSMVHLLALGLERFSAPNAFLACRQVLRQRTRSSLTAGVLFVAVVMSVAMGNSVLNNTDDVRQWVKQAVIGDFLVRGTAMLDMTTGESPAIPHEVLEQVRAIPGIATVEPWTFASTRVEGRLVMLIARSFPDDAPLSLDLYRGQPDEVRRRLREGETVISTVLARRLDKKPGDTITLSGQSGPQTLRIAGTADDYIMGGTVLYMDRAAAERLLGITGIHALLVRVEPGQREAVRAVLERQCQENGLLLHSTAELARTIDGMMAGIMAAMWGMLLVGFVVAAFGVVNTLTMNVLEQTRELGMLRVVGMTRPQVRRYIVGQAAVLGIVGIIPGAAVGEGVAYIVNRISDPMIGHPIEFGLRPEVIVGCVVFGLLLTVVAALLPASRAAGLLIGEAIQYE